MSESPNPYAAPVAVAVEATAVAPEFAGGVDPSLTVEFGPRAGARIIDMIAHYGLTMIGGFIGGLIAQTRGSAANVGIIAVGGMLSGILSIAISEWRGGASFGKLMLGLRVLDENGQHPSLGKTLGRNLAYYIDALFFGLVGYSSIKNSPHHQRYGDKWAGTVVVKNDLLPTELRRANSEVVVAVAIGAAIDVGVQALFVLL